MSITPEQFERFMRICPQVMEDAIGPALFHAGERVQVAAQLSITDGAVSGKDHVPSKPGEPPNNDTGVLANNIETVQITKTKVEVSSNAPYGAIHEFGGTTAEGYTLPPRPYMAPAALKETPEARRLVQKAVRIAVRRAMAGVRNGSR